MGICSAIGHVSARIRGYFCKHWRASHVGAFKKSWRSACQRDDGSYCEQLSGLLIIQIQL